MLRPIVRSEPTVNTVNSLTVCRPTTRSKFNVHTLKVLYILKLSSKLAILGNSRTSEPSGLTDGLVHSPSTEGRSRSFIQLRKET